MDLSETIAPKSDQLNADDLIAGPRTFTITDVKAGNAEQPVNIYLAEFPNGRPWKPSKSMRRVLVHLWGRESAAYIGRRLTLYRDASITFGKDAVGGVRISHMSDLDGAKVISLTKTRGRREPFKVEPLPDAVPSSPPVDEGTVAALAELRAEWVGADAARRKVIAAEVAALGGVS